VDNLKVSTRSNPHAVAGALAGALRRDGVCGITVIGAGALNQAMKAVVIARELVRHDGLDPVCVPSFVHLDVAGLERTALALRVEHRPAAAGAPPATSDAERDDDAGAKPLDRLA